MTITEVIHGGQGEALGLQAGDIYLRYKGVEVTTSDQFIKLVPEAMALLPVSAIVAVSPLPPPLKLDNVQVWPAVPLMAPPEVYVAASRWAAPAKTSIVLPLSDGVKAAVAEVRVALPATVVPSTTCRPSPTAP